MWDSNAPLQLLKSMPKKLGKEHLEKIQMVIDADKYKNSLISGFDLCGMYAPFCRDCKKTSTYPCALAYVNMKKNEGMDVEIDAKPLLKQEEVRAERAESVKSEVVEETAAAVVEEGAEPVEIAPPEEEIRKEEHVEKRKIRIAVARKKLF